ncbi:MAG: tyrosine-type recombinase/integrase [Alphaproteobacteria bacterium]|nr:tyrosine-type recombinase/integrase [Alphaproteobacteria bacterium]
MASVRKRKWKTKGETRFAWVVDFVGRDGKRGRQQFDTRAEADAYRITIEGDIHRGDYRAQAGSTTVQQAARLFLDHCHERMHRRERMTRHNLNVYEGHIANYIAPSVVRSSPRKRTRARSPFDKGLDDTTLRELTTGRVERFCDDLKKTDIAVPTIRKILGTLKQILRFAVSRDLVAINVARDVRVIGRRDQGARKIVPPSKEDMRLLIAAADEDFRVMLVVAAATGARAGEFHALRWKHVDLARGEVRIITRVDAYGSEDVTKTEAGMREVPLGSEVVAMLKDWKRRSKFTKPDDLVFTNERGNYVNHDNMVKRRFRPLFEKLQAAHEEDPVEHPRAPAYFNWHALRHFAISCWIEADLKPKTVQTFAGHSSLQVTMDRYGHLFKSEDHKATMDRIAKGVFGGDLKTKKNKALQAL